MTAHAGDEPEDVGFPRAFGTYTLLAPFAVGGMGEIFLARLGGFGGAYKICLLKTLRGDVARNPGYVERFMDEARVVMGLQHTGICQVFDAGNKDGTPYLAMELVRGVDLRTFLDELKAKGRALGQDVALYLACEVIEALDFAHRHIDPLTGKPMLVVHRDVSPHNVLLSFEGEVKLIDFGLAQSSVKESHTESNIVLGKVAYMAPEHARGLAIDARADQFSAAVLAIELLTGERFYGDMSSYDVWQIVGRGGFLPKTWPLLDAELQRILLPAIAADVNARYANCGELAALLRAELVRRHPTTSKVTVRTMLQRDFAARIEKQNARIAKANQRAGDPTQTLLADNPYTSSPDQTLDLDALNPLNRLTALNGGRVEHTTGSTRTSRVSRSQKPQQGRGVVAIAVASGAVLLAGVTVIGIAWASRAPVAPAAPVDVPAAVAVEPAPVEPAAPVAPAPAVPVAPVAPAPVAPVAPAPVAAAPVEAAPAPVERTRARTHERAKPLTLERKVERIVKSNASDVCARVVKRADETKQPQKPAIVDDCYRKLFER